MLLPELPLLEPANYRWEKPSRKSRLVQRQRRGNGFEAWVGVKRENAKGHYDFYLNTTLRLGDGVSVSLASLKKRFASSLIHFRTHHPEVAFTVAWDEAGLPRIRYAPLKSMREARRWAENVVRIKTTNKDGLGVRAELVEQRCEAAQVSGHHKPAKSVAITLIADVTDETTLLTSEKSIGVLMHFNHIYWDGISARQFASDLLQNIGKSWDTAKPKFPKYSWGKEVVNASPPVLDAMRISVKELAEDFIADREKLFEMMAKSCSSWGLDVTVKSNMGKPRTQLHAFTVTQSDAMIRAIKTRVGPQYTMSNFGHIATVLALLKINPIPSNNSNAQLVTALTVDGRRFLRDEYADKYPGSCQTMAVVEFEDLKSWMVDEADKEALVAMLERGCKHVKESYDYWLSKDYLLAMGISDYNFMSNLLSKNPIPFTGTGPIVFVTDGIVDRYIPVEISSANGEKLMTVDNCVLYLDTYLPNLIIRMESWKGATALTITYNDGYYSAEEAKAFLNCVADIMLAFVQ